MISNGVDPQDCRFLKIEHRGKMKIFDLFFDSISAVELFLANDPPVNRNIYTFQASITADEQFAGPPLAEAIAYCVGGYDQDYGRFLKLSSLLRAPDRMKVASRNVEPAFVGHRPNVPAYIADAPKNMYRTKRVAEKKVVNVFMQIPFDMSTTDTQILHRGILALNLIHLLEDNGYIVRFRVFEVSYIYNEFFKCEIILKQTSEKLDPRKCFYPMCGKGFVRRIMIRIKESMPFSENWSLGYGRVSPPDYTKSLLGVGPHDIYIGTPKEMGIKGEDLFADANAFLKTCGLDKHITIPHYGDTDDGSSTN